VFVAQLMEAVNFYQTTRRNNPEDSHYLSRRFENLKTHKKIYLPFESNFKQVTAYVLNSLVISLETFVFWVQNLYCRVLRERRGLYLLSPNVPELAS
jgi:hypothetical protein